MPGRPELRLARRLRYLPDHFAENLVAWSEGHPFLYLNLQCGRVSLGIVRIDDNIVERMSLGRSLAGYAIDGRPRQASGFCADQHRKQVGSADLAFEMASGGSGRCCACYVRQVSPCL